MRPRKRKRTDTQVLHPEVAARLREWLASKAKLPADGLLFPISAKVPGGVDRRGAKMMRADLKAARKKWIEEAETDEEKQKREESDFLAYCDENGLYADFHANRHTFITNLSRAGVKPRTAQALARHSDIRLTMGVYTHIGLEDQALAIEALPAPPPLASVGPDGKTGKLGTNGGATGHPGENSGQEMVPKKVPSGAENGAVRLASETYQPASSCTENGAKGDPASPKETVRKPANGRELCAASHQVAPCGNGLHSRKREVRPTGFEPVTLGSEDRCAIQLRHGR